MYFPLPTGYTDKKGEICLLTVFVRTAFLFAVIIVVMRLMGKRQIGQLQPAELVVTILLSEVAAAPMVDKDIPLVYSLTALMLLTGFELLLSFLALKNAKIRTVLQGNSVVLIRNGEIDYEQSKKLRYTLDDILEALRQKDVFDISEVDFAVAETNGSLSVYLKPQYRTPTTADLKCIPRDNGIPCTLIADGEILPDGLRESGISQRKVDQFLQSKKKTPQEILLLTVDGEGKFVAFGKDGKQC